jgi:hypothetical protein
VILGGLPARVALDQRVGVRDTPHPVGPAPLSRSGSPVRARVARFEGDPQTGGRLTLAMFESEDAMRKGDAAMTAGQPRNAGTRTSVELYEIADEVTL